MFIFMFTNILIVITLKLKNEFTGNKKKIQVEAASVFIFVLSKVAYHLMFFLINFSTLTTFFSLL